MVRQSGARRQHRSCRLLALLVTVLFGLGLTVLSAPTASAAPTASMSIQKSADVSNVTPGQTFEYTIQVQCTAGT
jgi:hypothetical protein